MANIRPEEQIQVMVVDDEPLLRFHLQKMLQDLWQDVDHIIAVGSGVEAINIASEIDIHTVFMDIKMPGLSGIETAKKLRESGFQGNLVFVTAYDEHAIAAFEQEALDYLLKPVTEKRLYECIQRLQRRSQTTVKYELDAQQLHQLLPHTLNSSLQWVNASRGDTIHVIQVSKISCFIAEDKYTTVVTEEGEYLIKKSIKQLMDELNSNEFWRIHRSALVQVSHIQCVNKDDSGNLTVSLKGIQKALPVSRSNMHLFKQM
ncbi:LytR/AlgR family response regulator transcription factor [Marinomonas ostreistagni]|uniref:LytR/AlgR family response regulator transcription factor n=1 Tax=Marinomonas ostreistagni TaxID=359209 RepID=UPI001F15B2EA|nr:LytTR family DNA-binding domain-containing protein [Marinomonas ostreistagni]